MMVNWTIDLGNIIAIAAFLTSGALFAGSIRSHVKTLLTRVNLLEIEIKQLSKVLVALGRQDERLTAMDKRIDDLRRGKGFVVEDFEIDKRRTKSRSGS